MPLIAWVLIIIILVLIVGVAIADELDYRKHYPKENHSDGC